MIFGRLLRGRHSGERGSVTPEQLADVRAAVEREGRWERHVEWRISTVTSTLIERTDEPAYRRYRVRVSCDYVLDARCPTITPACEIGRAYEAMIRRLWREYGSASWATKTQLEPDPNAV